MWLEMYYILLFERASTFFCPRVTLKYVSLFHLVENKKKNYDTSISIGSSD